MGSWSAEAAAPSSSTCSLPPAHSTNRPEGGWATSARAAAMTVIARAMARLATTASSRNNVIRASEIAPLDLFFQVLDLLVHSLEAGVDLYRLGISLERVPVVADVLHDQSKARQRREMTRLTGQHLGDIGHRVHVVLFQEVHSGASVPRLHEVRLDLDNGTEHADCEIIVLVVGRLLGPAHQKIGGLVAGPRPNRPDAVLNRFGAGIVRGGLQRAEQEIKISVALALG